MTRRGTRRARSRADRRPDASARRSRPSRPAPRWPTPPARRRAWPRAPGREQPAAADSGSAVDQDAAAPAAHGTQHAATEVAAPRCGRPRSASSGTRAPSRARRLRAGPTIARSRLHDLDCVARSCRRIEAEQRHHERVERGGTSRRDRRRRRRARAPEIAQLLECRARKRMAPGQRPVRERAERSRGRRGRRAPAR